MYKQLLEDIKTAMKTGDKVRLTTLRSLMSECKNVALAELEREPNDVHFLTAVKRSIKKMESSIEFFTQGGRDDLLDAEKIQLDIVAHYLPKQLTREETEVLVAKAISETGATTKKEMSKVIKWFNENGHTNADMKIVVSIVQSSLA